MLSDLPRHLNRLDRPQSTIRLTCKRAIRNTTTLVLKPQRTNLGIGCACLIPLFHEDRNLSSIDALRVPIILPVGWPNTHLNSAMLPQIKNSDILHMLIA